MSKEIIYQGIDVSRWQGNINWPKISEKGIDFAIIRAGYCGYAGGLVLDTTFEANMKGAMEAGVDIGVYLYSYAKTATAARTAAKELLALLGGYKLTYPVVFDIEDAVNVAMGKEENTAICKAFLSTIAEAGYYPMLYTFKSFAESSLNMADLPYDLWLAQIASKPTYTGAFTMWQYSWTGRVDGISGDVDLDYCYVDYPAIIKEGGYNGFDAGDTSAEPEPEVPDADDVPGEDVPMEPAGATYKVVKNDNLTRIAAKYKVPLRAVIQANQMVTNTITGKTRKLEPDLIYVGDLINIPAKP